MKFSQDGKKMEEGEKKKHNRFKVGGGAYLKAAGYFPVSHSTEFTQSLSSALVALHISPKRHTLACNTPHRSNFFDATGKFYLFICQSQSVASSSWWFLQFVYH